MKFCCLTSTVLVGTEDEDEDMDLEELPNPAHTFARLRRLVLVLKGAILMSALGLRDGWPPGCGFLQALVTSNLACKLPW